MKFKILIIISLLLVIINMSGCGSEKNILNVTSEDYPGLEKLTAQEPIREELQLFSYLDCPYQTMTCRVYCDNGKLKISSDENISNCHAVTVDYGYFLGVDMGEFDGWVNFYPYHSTYPEAGNIINVVSDENCRGLIKIDNRNVLLFTGLTHVLTDEGRIYKLEYSEDEGKWTWSLFAELGSAPKAFIYSKDTGMTYVATFSYLLSVDSSGNVTKLTDTELWRYYGTKLNSRVGWKTVYRNGYGNL